MKRLVFKKSLFLSILLCFCFTAFGQTHKVFAHYMVSMGSYEGSSVEGYKRDIKEAIEQGIDGFAINFGGWDPRYDRNIAHLIQAIDELDESGSNFVFFFSVDACCGFPDENALKAVEKYISDNNNFKYNGRPFLSAWGGVNKTRQDWEEVLINPLKREGYDVYFVPYFFANRKERPSYSDFEDNYENVWKGFIDGYFFFGVVGLPVSNSDLSIIDPSEYAAEICHKNGLTYMGNVSTGYWGAKQEKAGRRYYEYPGGEGLFAQWNSILNKQHPEWVELVTWDDWDESTYFSPMRDIEKNVQFKHHSEAGFYKSHAGFGALNKYFIELYKTGKKPEINHDQIFYFYRTHPASLTTDDPRGEVYLRYGTVKDDIFLTVFLTEPADVLVTTGGKDYVYHQNAGISNLRVPFRVGEQTFKVMRGNKVIIEAKGEDILGSITEYDFTMYSGTALGNN